MGDNPVFEHEVQIWWPMADWKPAEIDTTDMTKSEAEKQQPIHPQLTVMVEMNKMHILAAVETNGHLAGHPAEHIKKITGDLLIVLGEVFNNVLFHAHKGNPGKKLHLLWSIRNQILQMIFKDAGEGFDVDAILNYDSTCDANIEIPDGRGLLLIRHFSQAEWSEGGTKITVQKNLGMEPPPEPAAAAAAA